MLVMLYLFSPFMFVRLYLFSPIMLARLYLFSPIMLVMLYHFQYLPLRDEVRTFIQKVSHWLHDMDTELSGEQWLLTIDKLQVGGTEKTKIQLLLDQKTKFFIKESPCPLIFTLSVNLSVCP